MEKSKCKTKVAALLVALMIIFIPFGSAFAAAPRSTLENLGVDDGMMNYRQGYKSYSGTYYVPEGEIYACLKGDFVNCGSSFNFTVVVRDNDAGENIRKVTERITVPSGIKKFGLQHLSNLDTRYGHASRYCSKEMTAALDLSTLKVGNYSFSFYVNSESYGVVTYVRVYSSKIQSFIWNAYHYFGIWFPSDLELSLYKLSKYQIKGTDYLWNMYVENQANGIFKGSSSRYAIRNVFYIACGRYPNTSEENALVTYCSRMGVPLTIKKIIYSGKAMNYIESQGMRV